MGTFANIDDPDEMPHNSASHQGLHCLQGQNRSLDKEIYFLEAITCDPSISCSFMENSIVLKRVKVST